MKFLSLLSISLFLSACVSHSMKYAPPAAHQGTTTKTVSKNFKKTWEELVQGLAQNNFVIDSVNKDSGLIVASKKLTPPSTFADCGKWSGHFKNARINEKYDFSGAESANFMSQNDAGVVSAVQKTTMLSSKSNIFVKKINEKSSSITVNSQFNLKFDMNAKSYLYPQGEVYSQNTQNAEWTSQDGGKIDKGGQTQCASNFQLETNILDFVK